MWLCSFLWIVINKLPIQISIQLTANSIQIPTNRTKANSSILTFAQHWDHHVGSTVGRFSFLKNNSGHISEEQKARTFHFSPSWPHAPHFFQLLAPPVKSLTHASLQVPLLHPRPTSSAQGGWGLHEYQPFQESFCMLPQKQKAQG